MCASVYLCVNMIIICSMAEGKMNVYVYVCACVHVCVCMCVRVYVCVSACVCVCERVIYNILYVQKYNIDLTYLI